MLEWRRVDIDLTGGHEQDEWLENPFLNRQYVCCDFVMRLPMDLVLYLLTHSRMRDIKSALLVCRGWNNKIDVPSLWSSLYFNWWGKDMYFNWWTKKGASTKDIFKWKFLFFRTQRSPNFSLICRRNCSKCLFLESKIHEVNGDPCIMFYVLLIDTTGKTDIVAMKVEESNMIPKIYRAPTNFPLCKMKKTFYRSNSSEAFYFREESVIVIITGTEVRVYHWKDQLIPQLQLNFTGFSPRPLLVSPFIIVVEQQEMVYKAFSLSTGKNLKTLKGVSSMDLCRNTIAVATSSNVIVWEAVSSITDKLQMRNVNQLLIVPSLPDHLIIAKKNGNIILANYKQGTVTRQFNNLSPSPLLKLKWIPTSKILFYSFDGSLLKIWDINSILYHQCYSSPSSKIISSKIISNSSSTILSYQTQANLTLYFHQPHSSRPLGYITDWDLGEDAICYITTQNYLSIQPFHPTNLHQITSSFSDIDNNLIN
eukprot:TRINITY_DN19143_c0_g1_i2.p1 TRINITY_DN19143_c0_g1~~TRINITY_DN19143_c0_g1_i2.p1  ORF type:complete len:502 (-),score=77.68 TRINITY_DN19143_c0_g1_i2:6-1445(-)